MWTIGSLTFAAPWALAFVALLPVLWWLLRVVPPAPRRLTFPAIRILLGLRDERQTTSRTPWWLVALRLIIAALTIVAVARPLLDARPLGFDGPLLLAVDNDWAAAKDWTARHALIDSLLGQAERDGRLVVLVTTAPPPDGSKIAATGTLTAGAVRGQADAIVPLPWPANRTEASAALDAIQRNGPMRVVWVSDGIGDATADAFAAKLRAFGSLEVALPGQLALAHIVLPPDPGAADLIPIIRRAKTGVPETV